MNSQCVLILHNIRSVHNVGAIFRTADAAGVSSIYLGGYTPTPIDRFNRPRKDFIKASLGAEDMKWSQYKNIKTLFKNLKLEGYEIIAIEQSPKSIDYKKIKPSKKIALIVGNEVDGLSKEILSRCDKIAEIKMHGSKESMNVSVALGIALFRILNI